MPLVPQDVDEVANARRPRSPDDSHPPPQSTSTDSTLGEPGELRPARYAGEQPDTADEATAKAQQLPSHSWCIASKR